MDDPQPSSGSRLRDIINPALEDSRKKQIQLELLDNFFEHIAEQIPGGVEGSLRKIFNKASRLPEEDRNAFIIEQMTLTDQMGNPYYTPVIPFGLPVTTGFTEYTAMDIKELPGYIRLHEAARDADVAVSLKYLLADEVKIFGGMGPPPRVVIDASKSYEEGAVENGDIYPQLPEREPPDPSAPKPRPGDFNI